MRIGVVNPIDSLARLSVRTQDCRFERVEQIVQFIMRNKRVSDRNEANIETGATRPITLEDALCLKHSERLLDDNTIVTHGNCYAKRFERVAENADARKDVRGNRSAEQRMLISFPLLRSWLCWRDMSTYKGR